MKIHYFYRRDYSTGFYNLEIIAWLEEREISSRGIVRLSFTRLERLKIFLSKSENFHVHTIDHDFGEKSAYGHWAHTRKELMEDMEKKELVPISQRNYERFRKVALALYQKQTLVDFSHFKGRQNYTIRQIIGD